MGPNAKNVKGHEETQMDRLSDLPDSLIHHILSLMETKFAVQTCSLSKRWVSLWTHLPAFNFDSKYFTRVDNMKRFVSHVLDRCNTINVLALSIHTRRGKLEQGLFDRIISFVLSHSVQELRLSFVRVGTLQVSPTLFRCQSLRVLKLTGYNYGFPRPLDFATLKSLSLCRVGLRDNNYSNIFSSCINLQSLVLTSVHLVVARVLKITAPALVNLTVSDLTIFAARDDRHRASPSLNENKLVISAPRLTSFNFNFPCYKPLSLSMVNSSFLDKVNFSILHFCDMEYQGGRLFPFLIKILQKFGNTRSLTVSSDIVRILSKHSRLLEDRSSPFTNLESLEVVRGGKSCKTIPLPVLNFFLRSSPFAEELQAKFKKGKKQA
ncbi:hypothetical protein SLEP1_g48354 [Rubroshorea leprosula]|uniref:F-box domain-containing protein n=1 Tax=Rubroshorea leprosula TaxID=152421 RepID=A0AAV5LTD8_9ROSI|nr:hypothetical protein SLEP1_g48354 [Rubroshorea leprosula]